jgi:hypothetical protein
VKAHAVAGLATCAALLLTLACGQVANAAEPCGWDARQAEASTVEGHRVSVVFSSFTGQRVRLQVAEQPALERTLNTAEWSAAYSGSVQCRLAGRTHFTVTVDGRTTGLYLNVDGPLHIYISPARDGVDVALHETDLDGYLLD